MQLVDSKTFGVRYNTVVLFVVSLTNLTGANSRRPDTKEGRKSKLRKYRDIFPNILAEGG